MLTKVLKFSIALLSCALLLSADYGSAQFNPGQMIGARRKPVVAAAPATYTYIGSDSGDSNDVTGQSTFSFNLGTASADRLVVVGVSLSSFLSYGAAPTAAATSLSQIVDAGDGGTYKTRMYAGVVSSGSGSQNIVINYATGQCCVPVMVSVWTATGLGSTTVRQTASLTNNVGPTSIAVVSGDFMFGFVGHLGTANNFTSSTQTPTAERTGSGTYSGIFDSADWAIASTNASFSIVLGGNGGFPVSNGGMVAATWR